jgi:U32 family peptidase
MMIMSPVDKAEEAAVLVQAGADELYGGFVSPAWSRKYSLLGSPNHRYFPSAQFTALKDIKRATKDAHASGAKFYIAFNSPSYTPEQRQDVITDAGRLMDAGTDAFIVSDIGLLVRFAEQLPEAVIHLSTLGAVYNSASAKFFAGLGANRIVLPRELTVAEVAGIVKANPGLEFDAFILIGKCPNLEGFCSFTHCDPAQQWPCEKKYEARALRDDGRAGGIIAAQAGWSKVNRRQACGLCSVPGLIEAGVTALKIVGRGGPTEMKLKMVSALREVIEMSRRTSAEGLGCFARDKYADMFGRECSPFVCYYPADNSR